MKTKQLLLLGMALLSFTIGRSQNAENKWGIGAHLGVMEYNGDYANEFYTFKQGYAVGASLARYINPSFDGVLHFFYDGVRSNDLGRLGAATWLDFYSHMYNLNILAKYKFNNGYLLKESARLAPYLLGGIGGNLAKTSGTGPSGAFAESYINPAVYAGAGLNLMITPGISLAVQSSFMTPFNDKIDGWYPNVAGNKGPEMFLENSVAVYITPGKAKKKDADGDGVIDKLDKCPNTPAGVKVDADGCPIDTDKDGIADYQDECPTVAGLKQFNGCPDTDGDGIQDKLDECPDVAGPAALKGCPDSDGDGVIDKEDRCPNTPKGYKVDKFGCPVDSDMDGIPDSEDACPDKPGVSELKGCPFDMKALISKYELTMGPILFDFDSYELKPAGIETLNKITNALLNHKEYGVQFDGHTDYVGTEAYNLKLSEKRANSAKDYLINKGVGAERIRLQYFGEAKPAQDNKNKDGRSLNRRVEWSIFELGK
jgi:outer membrane protein OmpA-like peptidoglycan-associated protein